MRHKARRGRYLLSDRHSFGKGNEMRLGKDLLNKPIISITDGRNLGAVKDIYLDSQLSQITGVYTGSEGLVRRKHFMIPSESVVIFGIDVILVKNRDVIVQEDERPEAAAWVRLSKLKGRQVDTRGGTKVAAIGDIIMGEQGEVTGFSLSKVYVEGPVAERGRIQREAMLDPGNEDGVMTIDLTKAEGAEKAQGGEEGTAAPAPPETENDTENPPSDAPADEVDTLSK